MPKTKVFLSLAIIVVAVALVGGATFAWFTSNDVTDPVSFQAGTLLIEASSTSIGSERWNPGDGSEERYTVTNVGTKSSFMRALLDGKWYKKVGEPKCETAMVRMYDDSRDFTYKWSNHPWFSYIKHQPTETVATFYFYAAQHYRVGEVDVRKHSEDGSDYLFIEIRLVPGYEMYESHVDIRIDNEGYSVPPKFGTWPYKGKQALSYEYMIPWDHKWDDEVLDIGVHGVVCGVFDADGSQDGDWVEWTPPYFYDEDGNLVESVTIVPCNNTWEYGTDDYLYYVGDENTDCLMRVEAGIDVELCITVNFADGSGNMFQNAKFILNASFEAIQTSNDAAIAEGWQFTDCLTTTN